MQNFLKGVSIDSLILVVMVLALFAWGVNAAVSIESARCQKIGKSHPTYKIKYDFWSGGCVMEDNGFWVVWDYAGGVE